MKSTQPVYQLAEAFQYEERGMGLEKNEEPGSVNIDVLTMAIEAAQDVVVITEADRRDGERDHRILYVNAAFERMTGYSRQEAVGKTCALLQGSKTDPAVLDRMGKAFDTWQSVRAELIHYRKDRSEFAVELQMEPLADRTGRYTHWISVQRDITELKRKGEDQRRSEDLIRIGVQVARLGLADIDYSTGAVNLSPKAAYLYGFGEREIAISRERIHATFHPDDAADLRVKIAESLNPRGSGWFEMDHRVVWPSGEIRWLRVRKQVRFDGQGSEKRPIQGTLAAFDVTIHKRAEAELRESQRRFRDLAGGVAHDFNNLLMAIAGHTSMLESTGPDSETKRHTSAVQEAAASASALTQQLLDLSGRHVFPAEVLNINECIARVVELSKPTLGPGIAVESALDPNAGSVRMNRTQLNQILLNLLINARDAVAGDGVVTISTSKIARSADEKNEPCSSFVEIEVRDSGGGIADDIMEHVFEPYFSTKLKPDGPTRGLGLAIVRTIVNDSGGSIAVENAVGAGARFTVLLPHLSEKPSDRKLLEVVSGETASRAKTILLVEDDKRVRDLIHSFLSAKGFQVLAAEDGQVALEIAQTYPGPISLLITDVRMPKVDGPSLARAVTQQRPGTPALLISGFLASPPQGEEDLNPGWLFLQKPFSLDALLGKLMDLQLLSR